jgi:(R)-amidase
MDSTGDVFTPLATRRNVTVPTVAACQMAIADLDVETNLERIRGRVAGLPAAVDVAAFPEHALTGFVPDERILEHAITCDGETVERLRTLAVDADCALVVGFVERAGETFYNANAYVGPDSVSVYRKRHLWGAERSLLTPGTRRTVVETPAGRAGLLTCYDLNFVEESAAFARRNVDALFVVGAWPRAHAENWRLLLRARALDGVRWVVGAGRTGRRDLEDAPTAEYAGGSCIVAPDGSVSAELDRESADCIRTLDPATLARHRAAVFPDSDPPDP